MVQDQPAAQTSRRQAPSSFFALGYDGVPESLVAGGEAYQFRQLYKHDFFAATALYERVQGENAPPDAAPIALPPPSLAVLKLQRKQSFYGFPMAWLGRFIACHEIAIYRKLQGIAGIPLFLGAVGPNGFLHAFVPGQELSAALPLTPAFFDQLRDLLAAIHQRGIAYVDANKRENILVGEDGRPYLIDFQISWNTFRWARHYRWARWMLRKFQAGDWYHFYKHKTRLAPHLCSPAEFAAVEQRNWYLQMHRRIAWPIISTRRRFLARYDLTRTR